MWPCIPVAVKATVILTHSLDGHEISVTLGWVILTDAITTNCKPIWPTQDYMQTHTPTCMHACNTCTHTSYSMRVTWYMILYHITFRSAHPVSSSESTWSWYNPYHYTRCAFAVHQLLVEVSLYYNTWAWASFFIPEHTRQSLNKTSRPPQNKGMNTLDTSCQSTWWKQTFW